MIPTIIRENVFREKGIIQFVDVQHASEMKDVNALAALTRIKHVSDITDQVCSLGISSRSIANAPTVPTLDMNAFVILVSMMQTERKMILSNSTIGNCSIQAEKESRTSVIHF